MLIKLNKRVKSESTYTINSIIYYIVSKEMVEWMKHDSCAKEFSCVRRIVLPIHSQSSTLLMIISVCMIC